MTTVETESPRKSTRERLLDCALGSFAERGYEATTIGEIEAAAGLVPRSGALYKHFPSKRALIDAALAERFGAIEAIDERLALMPQGDLRAELEVAARLTLGELERERDLCRLVMKEGDRFPEIAAAFHAGIVARGHGIAVAWLRARAATLGLEIADVEALAQVMTDALVGYVLQQNIFGPGAVAVSRERVIAAWVALALSHLDPERSEATR